MSLLTPVSQFPPSSAWLVAMSLCTSMASWYFFSFSSSMMCSSLSTVGCDSRFFSRWVNRIFRRLSQSFNCLLYSFGVNGVTRASSLLKKSRIGCCAAEMPCSTAGAAMSIGEMVLRAGVSWTGGGTWVCEALVGTGAGSLLNSDAIGCVCTGLDESRTLAASWLRVFPSCAFFLELIGGGPTGAFLLLIGGGAFTGALDGIWLAYGLAALGIPACWAGGAYGFTGFCNGVLPTD